jgi:hypothetical protein
MAFSKFKIGDYVRVLKSQSLITGKVARLADHQGRYLVQYDSGNNDTSIIEQALYYEDELASCPRPEGSH